MNVAFVYRPLTDLWLPVGGGKGRVWEDGGEDFEGVGHDRR
jgi:hypothetical protein